MIVDTIPGLVATLTPAGEVEFVNSGDRYCGQGLEAMKQWGTNGTIHLDDLPHVVEPLPGRLRRASHTISTRVSGVLTARTGGFRFAVFRCGIWAGRLSVGTSCSRTSTTERARRCASQEREPVSPAGRDNPGTRVVRYSRGRAGLPESAGSRISRPHRGEPDQWTVARTCPSRISVTRLSDGGCSRATTGSSYDDEAPAPARGRSVSMDSFRWRAFP